MNEQFDVIVVGSGTGMLAALTAADAGLSVLVVEKSEYFGGSTALSGEASGSPPTGYCLKAATAGNAPRSTCATSSPARPRTTAGCPSSNTARPPSTCCAG